MKLIFFTYLSPFLKQNHNYSNSIPQLKFLEINQIKNDDNQRSDSY